MKTIVIGAVAAGMSAASKIKRLSPETEVIVYEAGGDISYGACGLPYYISGDNNDLSVLYARPPEYFSKVGIDVKVWHVVTKVFANDKKIAVRNVKTGDLIIDEYDKLFIASGARARVPLIKGAELDGVYTLKTVKDAEKIKSALKDVENAVIIGGGFIGVELCEAFLKNGKNVTIIESADRILSVMEPEMSEMAAQELYKHNVLIRTSETVCMLEGDSRVKTVLTNKGTYNADIVIFSIGVMPNTEFLKGTGVALAANGAVIVDRELRTNVTDIYAAGDCAVVYSRIAEENVYLPLGGPANKCGRIAAGNMLGGRKKFIGVLGSAAVKAMGVEMAQTGLTAAQALAMKLKFTETVVDAPCHPIYYPNHTFIKIKLICEKGSGRLLGASAGGEKGAVLRIDALAVAVYAGICTVELSMLDFCYAPPFSTVWDAINIAANNVK